MAALGQPSASWRIAPTKFAAPESQIPNPRGRGSLTAHVYSNHRVVMGQRPTHRSQSQDVTPAKAGVYVCDKVDSRFRGNDVTFDGVPPNNYFPVPDTLAVCVPSASLTLSVALSPLVVDGVKVML